MVTSRWTPWNDLLSAQGQVEQFFNEVVGRGTMPQRVVQALPLDIRQTDDAFCIEASVPGFRPEDVEITFDESVLTIRGSRQHEDDTRLGTYVQRERHLSAVHRDVHLPAQVRGDEITANFHNGVLTIMVPRARKAQPKRIAVTTAPVEEPKVIEAPLAAASGAAV